MSEIPFYERIDLERCGTSALFVRKWLPGYDLKDAGAPNAEDFLDGSLDAELRRLEQQGYCVWVDRRGMGHALKAPIVRIDILQDVDGFRMKKYMRGWKAQTRPAEEKIVTRTEITAALQWLTERKWTIIEWEGANWRAFKGEMYPVHDEFTIKALRRKYPNVKYNLAFYY